MSIRPFLAAIAIAALLLPALPWHAQNDPPEYRDRKSLEVAYRCGEIDKTASAFEHRTISLDCCP